MCMLDLCCVRLLPWTIVCQAPLPMKFSRQEILEWVVISFSRGSFQHRGLTHEKVGLKLNIQKTKIMASGPFTLRQIDGERLEIV